MARHPLPTAGAVSSLFLAVVLGVALVASSAGASAATQVAPAPSRVALDRLVHATALPAFASWWEQSQARAHGVRVAQVQRWWQDQPARFDDAASRRGAWDLSTDRCSYVPDRGPGFDFRWPCVRHDFGWRNLRRLDPTGSLGINTRTRRRAVSQRFLMDMVITCGARPLVQRAPCVAVARTYFAGTLAVA